ncbi:hypothetical protein SDC9_21311 [bioreactor metagenome]|uniref:Uncharacterized protein n=1 Tax=bioreactor metagenome TaxID=1076179 RepID=A0A644U963_9ZZZZ
MRDRRAGEGRDVQQPAGGDRGRHDMRLVAHPHQDRPDLEPSGLRLEDVAHPRGGVGIAEDQHVRRALEPAFRHQPVPDLGREGGVDVHLALIGEIGLACVKQRHRCPHPSPRVDVEVAELAVRAQCHLRRQPEAAHVPRRADHRGGDLLGRRFVVDMGVGDEQRPVLEDHQAQRADRVQPVTRQHLTDIVQVPQILPEGAADHAVGVAAMNGDRRDRGGVGAQDRTGKVGGDAAPRHQPVIGLPIVAIARVVVRVDDLEIGARPQRQTDAVKPRLDHLGAADQDRPVGGLLDHRLRGAQHALVLALGEDDPARGGGGRFEHRAHQQGRLEHRALERALVGGEVLDRAGGDAGLHRGLRHRRGDDADQPQIEGFRDQVIGAEGHLLAAIGRRRLGRGGDAGKRRDALDAGDLHLVVDRRRPDVERAAEDEGEAQDVVDLVRKIRAAGGDDRVGGDRAHLVGQDLGGGVRQREDDRARRHLCHMFGFQHTGAREAEEHVGATDHVIERAQVGLLRIGRLLRVHVLGAAFVDEAVDVAQPDVLALHAELQQHVQAGDAGGAAAGRDDLDLVEFLARDPQCVRHRGADHDRGAVLVIVEHRDVHPLAADLLDDETVGGLDVLEVDRAEGGFHRADDFGQLFRVGLIQLDVEGVDIGEFLEQDRLALHHRLRGERADVAKAQHRGAVRHHRNKVAARGVARRGGRVRLDLEAGLGHTRGIGAAQVAAIGERLRRADLELPGLRKFVVVERGMTRGFVP